MTLTKGTNAGFVTVAPTVDPDAAASASLSDSARAFKDTTSAGNKIVTEMGWWCQNATEEANFEMAIYDHDSGENEPGSVVGSISSTNAKGTTLGWKVITGLNIPLNGSTDYWIAVQLDSTATVTRVDRRDIDDGSVVFSATTLETDWPESPLGLTRFWAYYAVVEDAPAEDRPLDNNLYVY